MSQSHVNIYRHLIGAWAGKNMKDIDFEQSFKRFLLDVQLQFNISITYDSDIVKAFQSFFKKVQFQTYDLEQHLNQNREKLFKIADTLFTNKFIGKQQYQKIKNYRPFCLKEMAKQYLQIISFSEKPMSRIEQLDLWTDIIPISNLSFWNFVDQQKIEDHIITQLFNKGVFEADNKVPQTIINRKTLISNPYLNIELNHQIKPRRGNRIPSIRNIGDNFHPKFQNNSEVLMSTYDSFQQVVKTNFSMWMNEQKYKKMNSYIQQIESSVNQIVKLLTLTAFQSSLFYNRDHKYILVHLKQFIEYLQVMIEQSSQQIDYVDLFGSLRSTISLVNEYDIDITAVPKTPKKRDEQKNLLFKFNSKLKESKPQWMKSLFIHYRPVIPVPFMKVVLDNLQIKRSFELINVSKIDITVGNKTAIINSQMFSYFAQKEEILLFCLLVKLWAKSNNIINSATPMQGLSGYGVILMCIFYLMKTNQLDFLEPQLYVNPQKISMPKVLRCEMHHIETNFSYFLKFYGQGGAFHEQKMMASLLESPPRDKFDEEVIINMYDFIDERNPGRLSIQRRQFFYQQFRKAWEIMNTRDPAKISSLFVCKKSL